MDDSQPLRIGTRASSLAVTQTGLVVASLRAAGSSVEVVTLTTRADQGTPGGDVPIATLGSDGVFVRELERALLDGRIDAAVHSLKDMPTAETPGLELACVPERALAFDVLVGRTAPTLAELPAGAVVGSSSIRRVVQVQAVRPDLHLRPIRGNVDTRLRRLDDGEYDALVLAGAGLTRLGLASRITEVLAPPRFWPAVSQGALVVQVRAGDARATSRVAALDHAASHAAVRAERACLAALAGGCLAPIGAWGRFEQDGRLVLEACVFEARDQGVHRIEARGEIPAPAVSPHQQEPAAENGSTTSPAPADVESRAERLGRAERLKHAERLGQAVANLLLEQGAAEMLASCRASAGGAASDTSRDV
jgi:hydroxymethylbilane synthase